MLIDRLLQNSESLTAMTAKEQKRLADENTTRREKQQQVTDRLINENTLALEKFGQATARASVALQNAVITKFSELVQPVMNNLGNKVGQLEQQLRKGLDVTVTGTVQNERITLRGSGGVR